jgi:hypothetical protein
MELIKKTTMKMVDLRILMRLLLIRKSRPRVLEYLKRKNDDTSKRIFKFLMEHTSQFTNQNKFPIVNFLSCMPSVSLLELTYMLVDINPSDWFVVVTCFGFMNQMEKKMVKSY